MIIMLNYQSNPRTPALSLSPYFQRLYSLQTGCSYRTEGPVQPPLLSYMAQFSGPYAGFLVGREGGDATPPTKNPADRQPPPPFAHFLLLATCLLRHLQERWTKQAGTAHQCYFVWSKTGSCRLQKGAVHRQARSCGGIGGGIFLCGGCHPTLHLCRYGPASPKLHCSRGTQNQE